MPRFRSLSAAALAIAFLTLPAQAALLTSAYETQLESWLGQGNLDFTNIYTKATGDDEIVFGGPNNYSYSDFQVGELEVYTFTPGGGGNVPDDGATLGLLSVSLLGPIAARRRLG